MSNFIDLLKMYILFFSQIVVGMIRAYFIQIDSWSIMGLKYSCGESVASNDHDKHELKMVHCSF